jgi:hypothetical protein
MSRWTKFVDTMNRHALEQQSCDSSRPVCGAPPQRISIPSISFFARVRERTSWLRRDGLRRIRRVHSSGSQTASSSPAASRLASVRASSRPVLARACGPRPSGSPGLPVPSDPRLDHTNPDEGQVTSRAQAAAGRRVDQA